VIVAQEITEFVFCAGVIRLDGPVDGSIEGYSLSISGVMSFLDFLRNTR
jgi:hypothetical protein